MSVKAVCFDLDNTLYSYDRCNAYAEAVLFENISKRVGISIERVKELFEDARSIVKERLGQTAASHNRLLYMQEICELTEINPLFLAMDLYNIYWDSMLDKMELFDWVIPVLSEIKSQGLTVHILTDLTAHIQYRKIKKLGIARYIDTITTSEEAGSEKPSSAFFDYALSKIGVPRDKVILIGDDMKRDVIGARSVGIRGIQYKADMDANALLQQIFN